MIKAIIFDCFGVIITDSLLALTNQLRERDPVAAVRVGDIVKAANHGMINPDESNRQIAAVMGISLEEFQRRKYDGEYKDVALLDYIAGLRPRYKTAVLSNITANSLNRRLTAQEQARCFDVVIASAEIGHAKPEPEAYQIAAQQLSVEPEECVFIDDRDSFCAGAHATGMQAIHYQDFNQLRQELEGLLG